MTYYYNNTVGEALHEHKRRCLEQRRLRNQAIISGGRDVTPKGLGSGYIDYIERNKHKD